MKKEKQIGLRVGLPAFFLMELEEYHRHAPGAHRAMKLNDFAGYLLGLGLEEYRRTYGITPNAPSGTKPMEPGETADMPDEERRPQAEPLHLFDMAPENLPDLFREFDEAMKAPETKPGLHLVRSEELA